MSDNNIDKLFKKQLDNHQPAPPSQVWERISDNIAPQPRKRVVPVWAIITGIAAALLLLFSISIFFNTDESVPKVVQHPKNESIKNHNNSLDTDKLINDSRASQGLTVNEKDHSDMPSANTKKATASKPMNSDSTSDNYLIVNSSNKAMASHKSNKTSAKASENSNSQQPDIDTATQVNDKHNVAQDKNKSTATIRNNDDFPDAVNTVKLKSQPETNNPSANTDFAQTNKEKIKNPADNDDKSNSKNLDKSYRAKELKEAIAASQDSIKEKDNALKTLAALDEDKEKEQNDGEEEPAIMKNRWQASTAVAPIYSNTVSGSSIGEEFSDNSKSAGLNLSYGVGIAYQVSPRLSVRTGVHQIQSNFITQDIAYGVNVDVFPITPIDNNDNFKSRLSDAGASSNATEIGSSFSQELVSDNTFNGLVGELSQRLGYVEVPLELRYRLIDKKLGLNLIGGFSALFLTENEVSVYNGRERLELGADDNINDFNQSANFGLGLDYSFNDKLGITVEPMAKYQLSTLRNDSTGFRGINLGLYTGVTYRF